MRLQWRCDVHHTRLIFAKHLCRIDIASSDAHAHSRLRQHQCLSIAHSGHFAAVNCPDLLCVAIGNLAAADNRDLRDISPSLNTTAAFDSAVRRGGPPASGIDGAITTTSKWGSIDLLKIFRCVGCLNTIRCAGFGLPCWAVQGSLSWLRWRCQNRCPSRPGLAFFGLEGTYSLREANCSMYLGLMHRI